MDFETYLKETPEHREMYDLMTGEQQKTVAEAFAALSLVIERLMPAIKKMAQAFADMSRRGIASYPNKRVVHLASHAKKKRTRKKNIHRIMKDLERWGRNASY